MSDVQGARAGLVVYCRLEKCVGQGFLTPCLAAGGSVVAQRGPALRQEVSHQSRVGRGVLRQRHLVPGPNSQTHSIVPSRNPKTPVLRGEAFVLCEAPLLLSPPQQVHPGNQPHEPRAPPERRRDLLSQAGSPQHLVAADRAATEAIVRTWTARSARVML